MSNSTTLPPPNNVNILFTRSFSGPHTMCRPARYRIASVGPAMEGATLYIDNPDDDGQCGEVISLHATVSVLQLLFELC